MHLESFRTRVRSTDFPRIGRFAIFGGELWADTTTEQAYTRNDVKFEYSGVLRPLAKDLGTGRCFGDGMLLSHPRVGFSTVPDGMFVTFAALEAGRIREVNAPSVGAAGELGEGQT